MSVVTLLGVEVLNNPAKFGDKYQFEITFECLEPLEKGSSIDPTRSCTPPRPGNSQLLASLLRDTRPLTRITSRSRMEADLRRLRDLVSLGTFPSPSAKGSLPPVTPV